MDPIFDENDLKNFFHSEPSKPHNSDGFDAKKREELLSKPPTLPEPPELKAPVDDFYDFHFETKKDTVFRTIFKFFGIFILIFIISFSIINGQALIQQFKYLYNTELQNKSWASNTKIPTPVVNQSRIIIPKINVDAPIIWNVSSENMTKTLESGVAHYKGTAMPGQVGNVFITGHSSYYIWADGSYKDVFALLTKLEAGDKIYIQYNGANFVYTVSNRIVVNPSNLTVLNQTDDKTLSLMTCVPVGTNLQRLVVTAKQIPD